jgi:hypothetical protein
MLPSFFGIAHMCACVVYALISLLRIDQAACMSMYLYVVVQLPCLHVVVPVGSSATSLHLIHVVVLACEELTCGCLFWFLMI